MPDTEITLRNTMRRPLSFQVAGRTVRLAPGEAVKVPAAWTGSPELQRFSRHGFVAAEPVAAGRKAATGAGESAAKGSEVEGDEADSGRRVRGRGGGRTGGARGAHVKPGKQKPTPPRD